MDWNSKRFEKTFDIECGPDVAETVRDSLTEITEGPGRSREITEEAADFPFLLPSWTAVRRNQASRSKSRGTESGTSTTRSREMILSLNPASAEERLLPSP